MNQNNRSSENGITIGKTYLPRSPLGLYALPGGVLKTRNALYYDKYLKSKNK